MDGNRRWAKTRNLPTLKGHEEGANKVRDVVEWSIELGVSHLYLYAFSTENWKRTEEEVGYLMRLMERVFTERVKDLEELGVRIKIVGERERFSVHFQKLMSDIEERSKDNTNLIIVFCLSYGGRSEIVSAVNTLMREGKTNISEEDLGKAISTSGMPDPNLIIRTGGRQRLSNFLTWQSIYSELIFTDTLWPDYSREEFERHLAGYRESMRNFGV